MSKSLGNVIDPVVLIEGQAAASVEDAPASADSAAAASGGGKKKGGKKAPAVSKPGEALGVDLLRLWVCSTDYSGDVSIGKTVLAKTGDAAKKLRASARFMLGCLNGLEARDVQPFSALPLVDRYLLHLLTEYAREVTAAYEAYSFKDVFAALQSFNSAQLSAFFMDINKDRLYADAADSPSRRAAQSALLHALVVLTKSLAPVAPHLAEDVYQHVPFSLRPFFHSPNIPALTLPEGVSDSLFIHGWITTPAEWRNDSLAACFESARRVRSHVTKLLESLRQDSKLIANFSEAAIDIEIDLQSPLARELAQLGDDLNLVLTAARTRLIAPGSSDAAAQNAPESWSLTVTETDSSGAQTPLVLRFSPAPGAKCPRCRRMAEEVNEQQPCCARCTAVLRALQ